MLLVVVGCSDQKTGSSSTSGSNESTKPAHAGRAPSDIRVEPGTIERKPRPWVLTTPESAVRSYLDWSSYAYRIGQSEVAYPTMSTYEQVRVDSYVQYNLEKFQLIDQKLESITFGKASVTGSGAVLPAKEKWTYRYVSIKTAGKTLSGPHSANYDVTYTLIKNPKATSSWVVDSVRAKAVGEVQ